MSDSNTIFISPGHAGALRAGNQVPNGAGLVNGHPAGTELVATYRELGVEYRLPVKVVQTGTGLTLEGVRTHRYY